MKKILLLLLTICALITGCTIYQTADNEHENDLQSRGLNGDVKSIRTEIFQYKKTKDSFDIGKKINSYSADDRDELLEFNDYGNLTKRAEYNPNGKISNQSDYYYNLKNQIKKIVETDNYGKGSNSTRTFFYDSNDSIVKSIFSSDTFEIFSIAERDKSNRLIKRRNLVNDTVQMTFVNKYDTKGNLVEENRYKKDTIPLKLITKTYKNDLLKTELTRTYGRWDTLQEKSFYEYDDNQRVALIKASYENEKNYTSIEYTYDKNDNLVKQKVKPIGSERYSIIVQKWDRFGNQIEYSRTNGQTGEKNIWKSDYEYDKLNNWTLKIHFKDDKPLNIAKRKIEYAD